MIEDPELAAEAARIRDRARSFRVDFNRTGGEPKWRLVEAKHSGLLDSGQTN